MKEAAEHEPFQLPNEFTRVEFLLAGITSSDAGLQVTMANIKSDADATLATKTNNYSKGIALPPPRGMICPQKLHQRKLSEASTKLDLFQDGVGRGWGK
eukprot:5903371-Ditylum_brightwellii.AAC.1